MVTRPTSPKRRTGGGFRWAALVAAAALTVLTGGCSLLNGSSGSDSGPTSAGHTRLNIGIVSVVDDAPAKLAQLKGYFAEEGLDANVRAYTSITTMLPALTNGEVDISAMNYVSLFAAVATKTLDAKVVSDAYQGTPDAMVLLAKPSSGIHAPKDLVGRKVSVHARGNIVELLIRAVLQDNGVDPNSPVYDEVKFPDIPAALSSNSIDAGGDVEPYITQAEQQAGAEPTFPIVTGATADIPLSGYVATTKFIQAHPAAIAAFQRAMVKAQRAAADRGALALVLPELTGVDKQSVPLLKLGVYPTSVDASRLQRVANLMEAYGALHQPLNVSSLVVPTPAS